jgi:hypothetical protein
VYALQIDTQQNPIQQQMVSLSCSEITLQATSPPSSLKSQTCTRVPLFYRHADNLKALCFTFSSPLLKALTTGTQQILQCWHLAESIMIKYNHQKQMSFMSSGTLTSAQSTN